MQEIPVKDFHNRIIGWIRVDSNGNKTAYDFYRRIKGKYDARRDITTDFYGRIISRGDMTASLIQLKNN